MGKIYFILCSIGLLTLGTCLLIWRLRLFIYGTRTTGIVVDWEPRGRIASYHPVVEFTATDGLVYRVTSVAGYSRKTRTKKADQSSSGVIYLAKEPSKALVYSFLHFWAAPLFCFLMAAVIIAGLLKVLR